MAGNANSGRKAEKPFRDALRIEIAALGDSDPLALRSIARRLLEKAAEGDMQAIKELADRTDGKAVQQLDVEAVNHHYEISDSPPSEAEWAARYATQ
jgi:hypothetical protein